MAGSLGQLELHPDRPLAAAKWPVRHGPVLRLGRGSDRAEPWIWRRRRWRRARLRPVLVGRAYPAQAAPMPGHSSRAAQLARHAAALAIRCASRTPSTARRYRPTHQSRPSRSRSASRSSSAKIDSGAGSPTWALISWTSCRSRSAAAWSPTSSEAHCTRTRSPHARRGRARRALPGVAAPGSGRRVRHHRCQARTHVLGGRAPEPARAQCWHVNTPVSGHALARLRVQRAAHPTRG